jgi:hypothetical protein
VRLLLKNGRVFNGGRNQEINKFRETKGGTLLTDKKLKKNGRCTFGGLAEVDLLKVALRGD